MNATDEEMPEFKLILLGDGDVGKTTFIESHTMGDPATTRVSTNVDLTPLVFHTNRGPVKFNVWESAGETKHLGLRDGYFIRAQCAIIMFDLTSRITYKNNPNWRRDLTRMCGDNIPIVVVGNKADKKGMATRTTFHPNKSLQYYNISAKLKHNFEKPFLWLARKLSGDNELHFVEDPAIQPPDLQFDDATWNKCEAGLAAAREVDLPEEDDDDEDL